MTAVAVVAVVLVVVTVLVVEALVVEAVVPLCICIMRIQELAHPSIKKMRDTECNIVATLFNSAG
jgi:hypothetical protein